MMRYKWGKSPVSERVGMAGAIQSLGGDTAMNQRFVYYKQTLINRRKGHFVYNGELFAYRRILVGYK